MIIRPQVAAAAETIVLRPHGVVRLLPFLGLLGILLLSDSFGALLLNFHTVLAGQVYRSGALSAADLAEQVHRHGLRSVINLRGWQEDAEWYESEQEQCRRLGVKFIDVGLYARPPMEYVTMLDLITALDECSKPVLFHCQSGVERSSRVAAVSILLLDETGSLAKARRQLSLWYGNLPYTESRRCTEATLSCYEDWLNATGRPHSCEAFRRWAFDFYDPAAVAARMKS
jgi:protein tyrosine phosphatase (PTP) superfamily phosphohydrolase (DUF442 family)